MTTEEKKVNDITLNAVHAGIRLFRKKEKKNKKMYERKVAHCMYLTAEALSIKSYLSVYKLS